MGTACLPSPTAAMGWPKYEPGNLRLKVPEPPQDFAIPWRNGKERDQNWEGEGEKVQLILVQYKLLMLLRTEWFWIWWFPWPFSWLWLCNKKSHTTWMVGLNPTHEFTTMWFSNPFFSIRCSASWGQGYLSPFVFSLTNRCFVRKYSEKYTLVVWEKEQFYKK